MRLKDKVAVVTGGGGGLGEGICLCLAREGAHVVVSDVKRDLAEKVAAEVKEMGSKSLALQTDVRKEIDKRTISVLSAAVPVDNTVTITGGKLTEEGLNEAMSILEDQELTLKTILLRGRRFSDMKGWDLDPQTDRELFVKGVVKVYGGADIMLSSAMNLDEVLFLPDEEIGKWPIREQLKTDTIEQKTRFKTGWLSWMECGHGVTRPEIMAKLVIQP